tara:strand:+ start:154 stop:933 length:780 start_codon:yes stop_codon:yes gene_type:complete
MADQIQISNPSPDVTAEDAHNQEMLAKVEEVEHGIDGVKNIEQEDKFGGDYGKLKKSYEALEQKFHGQEPEEEYYEEDVDLGIPQASDAPFDMQALTQEYVETGELADTSYKTLEDAGISRDIANRYIEGQKALGQQLGNQVMSQVGGKDNYSAMVDWAKQNYSAEQIQAYDASVNSSNMNTALLAAKGLMSDYQGSTGSVGKTYGGQSPSGEVHGDTFRSNAEVVSAMRDSRYENDLAYRQDILDKLDRSDIFSTGTI